jgi:pullulanase
MSYLVTRPFEVIKGSALYIPDHVQETGDLIAHEGVGFVDLPSRVRWAMVFMDERCGGWQFEGDETQGALEFRIFFPAGANPHVTAIRVAGDFQHHLGGQDWDFAGGLPLTVQSGNDPRGVFWSVRTQIELPADFYQYKYEVDFENGTSKKVTDPCARYGGLGDQNSGVVVGGSRPADNVVRPLADGRKPLTDLTLYELIVDDFTADYRRGRAPLAAVIDRLDGLRELGVTAIEFMPWTAWKTTSSTGGTNRFSTSPWRRAC